MFATKKTTLFEEPQVTQKTSGNAFTNAFVNAGLKKSAETLSGNGALKYSTTGQPFVDQFGVLGSYKAERSFADISKDMSILYAEDPQKAIQFALYIRLVSRTVNFPDGTSTESVQRGAGLKHEGIMRMIWLNIFHKDLFWNNIALFVLSGSYRDIFEMLRYDLQYNGWESRKLDWDKFGSMLLAGLENPNTPELIKKYLPQIKAKSKCTTIESQANTLIGKWFSSLLFGNKKYSDYRRFKASGTAHTWQQLISKKLLKDLNFDTVHGRALSLLVSGKFLENNKLTAQYEKWIETKPVAKYTGFPHELFIKAPQKKYQIDTLNAQFKGLVETAKKGAILNTSMIVVRDTSGSMGSIATGTQMSCFNIAKALALFFSEMLPEGYFANSFIEFNSDAKMHKWKGSTPYEKWQNDSCSVIGSTEFQNVIKLFGKIKATGVPESDFPSGILCISDGEFNPSQLGKTNVESARLTLKRAGFSDEYINSFKIVLWNLQSNAYGSTTGKKFETYGDVENVYYFSGYDGSVVSFLTGSTAKTTTEPKNPQELFDAAMDQELLNLVRIK